MMHLKLLFYFFSFIVLSTEALSQNGKFKIITYNVRNAKGLDGNTDYDRIAALMQKEKADVIALQEIDSATKRSMGLDVLQILSNKTKMHGVYGAAISFQNGKYGVGLLSKQKPLNFYTIPLPGKEENRILLVAVFKKFIVFNTHLSLTHEDRMASIKIINNEAAKFNKPIYLVGDLNAEPLTAEIKILKESWQLLSVTSPTFPANNPNRCIDYVFIKNSKKKLKKSFVINEPTASDHRPVAVIVK